MADEQFAVVGADVPAIAVSDWESCGLEIKDIGPDDRMCLCELCVSELRERGGTGNHGAEPFGVVCC